jgi:hypothetical protein
LFTGGDMTKDEALKLAKSWFEANTYGDEAVEVYEAIEQALADSALDRMAENARELGLDYEPAPVQEPVGEKEISAWAERHDIQGTPTDLRSMFEDAASFTIPPAAQPAVPDAITDNSESPEYRTGWNDYRQAMMEMMK